MSVNLKKNLKAIAEHISDTRILKEIETLWSNDRHFTYPKFHATARKISATFREAGIKARTFDIPADGKTVLADWKMPLGWDCKHARLEIYDPFEERGEVLGDTKTLPCNVIMWSGATPEKGIVAEVVRVENGKELEEKKDQVKDKIVYTPADPRGFKKKLVRYGAKAVVSSFCRNAHILPDTVNWFNGWSDDVGGWAFQHGDSPLPGMAISSKMGLYLDVLLDRGRVRLKMKVDSEYLPKATIPISCGYIDATLQEEILAIGHVMEQGANDNASGGAIIIESLLAIQAGVTSGKLPPLKRAVRALLVNECYGTIGFAALHPGIMRRIIAAINWDTVGRHQESSDGIFRHHRCPDATASVIDTLILLLMEAWLPNNAPFVKVKKELPFALTDNCYNDPKIGVPCTYVDSQDRFWHTSSDTLEHLDRKTLHAFATISATYLHFLSTCTAKEAMWLAHQTVKRYGCQIETVAASYAIQLTQPEADQPSILARAHDHLTYLKEISDKAVMSAKKFMLKEERAKGHLDLLKLNRHIRRLVELEKRRLKEFASAEPGPQPTFPGIEEIAHLRPYKKFIGTPTYDSIPKEDRAAAPYATWDSTLHCALFWSQGKLTFGEIVRRVYYEYGKANGPRLVTHFKIMAKHGMVVLLEEGQKIPKTPAIAVSKSESPDGMAGS